MKNKLMMAIFLAAAVPAFAAVKLPDVISSGMVLQRSVPVKIWGAADPGEKVTVQIAGAKAEAVADTNGSWMVSLPSMEAGGPHEMTVSASNTIKLADILVGEVWLCSGQSNMSHPTRNFDLFSGVKDDVAAADFPKLRFFPNGNQKTWAACTPESANNVSAVGFYFGRELVQALDGVPVGIVVSAQIGSHIERWLPLDTIETTDWGKDIVAAKDSEEMKLARAAHREKHGEWRTLKQMWEMSTAVGMEDAGTVPPLPKAPEILRKDRMLSDLFEGMLKPVIPYTVRGFLWYQGEANVGDADYAEKQALLISTWRKLWGQGDLPFYFVQIAPCGYKADKGVLPEFWEQQARAARAVPNSELAATIDIGEPTFNIHPPNKREVGRRLSLIALAKTYGKSDIVWSGPTFKAMEVQGDSVRVKFDNIGSGLAIAGDGPLAWFEVAGADGKFASAEAVIDGDAVVVKSGAVKAPVAVRYAWTQTPGYTAGVAGPTGPLANLINKEGLPAYPFRSSAGGGK